MFFFPSNYLSVSADAVYSKGPLSDFLRFFFFFCFETRAHANAIVHQLASLKNPSHASKMCTVSLNCLETLSR